MFCELADDKTAIHDNVASRLYSQNDKVSSTNVWSGVLSANMATVIDAIHIISF